MSIDAIRVVDLSFQSGNSVPIEKASVTAAEWAAVKAHVAALEAEVAKSEQNHEIDLLRDVHEAARSILRFRGIDKAKFDEALVALATTTEALKDFDGGTSEFEIGLDRSVVFTHPGVMSYSVDPTDIGKIIQEDANGNKVKGRVIDGAFQPDPEHDTTAMLSELMKLVADVGGAGAAYRYEQLRTVEEHARKMLKMD